MQPFTKTVHCTYLRRTEVDGEIVVERKWRIKNVKRFYENPGRPRGSGWQPTDAERELVHQLRADGFTNRMITERTQLKDWKLKRLFRTD